MQVHRGWLAIVLIIGAASTNGCSKDASSPLGPNIPEGPAPTSMTVTELGPAGGTVVQDGCVLTVPPGALSETTAFSLTSTIVAGGRRVQVEPPLDFSVPGSLSLQRPAPAQLGQQYQVFTWSSVSGWEEVGPAATSAWLTVGINHLESIAIDLAD